MPELTERDVLEQAWELIMPWERWVSGEESTSEGDYAGASEEAQACIIGAMSIALMGGWGVLDQQSYIDFGTQARDNPILHKALDKLCLAIKKDYPNWFEDCVRSGRMVHDTHLLGLERTKEEFGDYSNAYKNWLALHNSSYCNVEPEGMCVICQGREYLSVNVVTSFNDRHPDGIEDEDYSKVHSEVMSIFQTAIKMAIEEENRVEP